MIIFFMSDWLYDCNDRLMLAIRNVDWLHKDVCTEIIAIFTPAFFVAMAAIVVYWSGIFEQRNLFLFTVCKLLNVTQDLWLLSQL